MVFLSRIIFEDAPPGNKSNTWFLVNNVDNMSRKTSNRHSKYYDDCGIWESSKGKVFHQDYLLSDNFRTIFLKNDQYCTKVRQGGKTLFVPITPQPDSESIVTMHRYSTVLKENNSFKKHVTWFNSSFDNDLPSIAVYEYSGTYCLENAKNYVRTHPKTLDKVVDECALKDNKEVFIQMNRDNSLHAPRDTKQIRDQGIASADDTLQFARADSELKDLCANHPQFLKYYEQSFKPRVEEFVNAPNRRLGTKQMWTNNNAESMNRVMKVAVNWKPQHAPDLVDKLFDMVDFQFINLRSALHHSGDYMLVNSYKQYTIADAIWKTKSDEEKRKLFNNFLQDSKKRKHENIITSSDGLYSVVNKAKSIAKKPMQRKRPRTERAEKRH
ncbi:unnamed protein product [Mytilus edulis]|uniref:Uncharacterized protein n=1 Tax=Mytilus edulis TaxID=6550 RepID=A0A8S3RGE6_MYTED|nr:unnamed protein product [Mytilus edulis]